MDPRTSSGKPEARPGLQNLFKAREKEFLKWIVSPLDGLQGKEFKSFHVRHEASMLELFFDLFFVANLATFTAYHEITTSGTVAAYIGFFLILWSTWFQITIFDVRFAADSVFERLCKFYQFVCFAIFAAIGSNFNPGTYDSTKYYRIYQTMAIVLGITRFLLALQYAVIAVYICPKYKKLVVPFILIITTFLISGTGFTMTCLGFGKKSISNIHVLWWILLLAESLIIVSISSFWRMLSFKETHMNERLSLLTMIIIGEGVIGITKTAGALWPTDSAPKSGSIIALLSIVIMLLLMWQIYFDNQPHGDYGTIKQQWWAMSHFFLHLGIVGVVEGCNRMAVFYYASQTLQSIFNTVENLCSMVPQPSRAVFVSSMNYTLQSLKLDSYDGRSYDWVAYYLNQTLYPDPTDPYFCDLNDEGSTAYGIAQYLRIGLFKRFGIDAAARQDSYYHTFRVTYTYLWCSFAVAMLMFLIFLWIVRHKKHDAFEWIRMVFRLVVGLVAIFVACISFIEIPFSNFITSPYVVTTICVFMGLTILVDRICRSLGVRSFKKKYAVPAPDPGHGHGHGEGHGKPDAHMSMAFGGHHPSGVDTPVFSPPGYEMAPSTASPPVQTPMLPGYAGGPNTPWLYQNTGI